MSLRSEQRFRFVDGNVRSYGKIWSEKFVRDPAPVNASLRTRKQARTLGSHDFRTQCHCQCVAVPSSSSNRPSAHHHHCHKQPGPMFRLVALCLTAVALSPADAQSCGSCKTCMWRGSCKSGGRISQQVKILSACRRHTPDIRSLTRVFTTCPGLFVARRQMVRVGRRRRRRRQLRHGDRPHH